MSATRAPLRSWTVVPTGFTRPILRPGEDASYRLLYDLSAWATSAASAAAPGRMSASAAAHPRLSRVSEAPDREAPGDRGPRGDRGFPRRPGPYLPEERGPVGGALGLEGLGGFREGGRDAGCGEDRAFQAPALRPYPVRSSGALATPGGRGAGLARAGGRRAAASLLPVEELIWEDDDEEPWDDGEVPF